MRHRGGGGLKKKRGESHFNSKLGRSLGTGVSHAGEEQRGGPKKGGGQKDAARSMGLGRRFEDTGNVKKPKGQRGGKERGLGIKDTKVRRPGQHCAGSVWE